MATSYNPYYSGGWQSGEEGGTPITPDALNHMDDGIAGAYDYTQQSTAAMTESASFTISAATTFILPSNARYLFVVSDSSSDFCGMYILATNLSGVPNKKDISVASGVTLNLSTANRLTVTPSTGTRTIQFVRISLSGGLPTIAT